MLIEKINEKQIKIILDIENLMNSNISLHSFMCNSKASQNLFLNILDFINENSELNFKKYNFNVESFFIPSITSFILVITYTSPKIYVSTKAFNKFKFEKSLWLKFDNIDNFCMFCNSLSINYEIHSSLYLHNNYYFLHISITSIKNYFKMLTMSKEFANAAYNNTFFLNANANIIVKDLAIETCKKYFI